MKSLSKLTAVLFIAAVLFFTTNTANAQTTPANAFRLGLGIETGLPTGNAKKSTTFTLGGTARLQYGLTNRLAVTFTAGGYHFFPKINPATNERYGSYGELPVKVGIKAFFLPNVYFGGEVGEAWEKLDQGWGPHRLDLAAGIGYANERWDVSGRFERFSNKARVLGGIIGLRVAYGFAL